jgi:hypothetical protein
MRAFASFVLVAIVLLVASGATAQREVAQERFRRGEAAYQKGNYALAVSEWQAAYAADPRPRIQYNLYQAYERLGKLAEAAESLQLYLQTADPDDESYGDATARMASLQQRLQATGIRVVGGVEGAQISVDGTDWGRIPRPDRIPVNAGSHRVVIQLQGYQTFTSTVVVPAGQVVDVVAELQAADNTAAPEATPTAETPRDEAGNGTPLFILSGVLAAGAVGSGVWMFNRASELSDCDNPDFYCPNEDDVVMQGNIALGLTIALGAGAVGTFVWALVVNGDDGDDGVAARCVPGVGGATCRWSF